MAAKIRFAHKQSGRERQIPVNMYYVYVIESINFGRYYKGMTQNLEQRLREHNAGKTRSNKAFAPFRLVYVEEFAVREDARKREKYFKSSAGKRYLEAKIIRPRSSAE
ncbi:MAG TPA: GIY-YIG nuclease family protein [Williamwhitmania sp.]|nr:GIY-YIG nuclease family protein [Williamwhitmania sp.]